MKKKFPDIPLITILQPWAYAILHEGKNVENRQKYSAYRGIVALHSSKEINRSSFARYKKKVDPKTFIYGAIVGFANIKDIITEEQVTKKTEKHFEGKYGIILEDVVALKKPIKIKKGSRGICISQDPLVRKALSQLSKKQIGKLKPHARAK